MTEWIYEVLRQSGYAGVTFLMALENIFPPIPSEVIMGLGGMAVARGHMSLVPLLAFGTLGATLGNYVLFLGADRLGYERCEPLVDRWGRWLTIEWNDVERSGEFLRSHGHWVVLFLRFMPMFRTIISIPAGLAHMGHIRFLVFTAIGSGIWNLLLVLAGRWFATRFQDAEYWLGVGTMVLIGLALVYYIYRVVTWPSSKEN
ncbi:DedA family protein [Novosphingobium sp. YJ-S2-02]|uniref:DedA family protein n=1 Tax=Novosphingobium aureum TaxID=2792964 RepID=A0A931HCV7_9SPHN|nr:DedA family protein [Novosphingobium aureum]MBH0113148.1 DedA family protein [Novosphingobium aureum]